MDEKKKKKLPHSSSLNFLKNAFVFFYMKKIKPEWDISGFFLL